MKTQQPIINRIIKHIDSLFIIDKIFDVVMIFIGLYAAIAVGEYYKQKAEKNEYLELLTRFHTELSSNAVLIEGYDKTLSSYFKVWSSVCNFVKDKDMKAYPGFLEIYSSQPINLQNREFMSFNKDVFKNKRLLADLVMHYDQGENVKIRASEAMQLVSEFYSSYFAMYNSEKMSNFNNEQYFIEFNLLYSKFSKYSTLMLKPCIIDYKNTNERILYAIEGELSKYGKSLDDIRDYSDYYWLSHYAASLGNYDACFDYTNKGLKILGEDISKMNAEEKSLYGRFNKNAYFACASLSKSDSVDSSKLDARQIEHLKKWENSAVYLGLCWICMMQYYHDKDNLEEFQSYLQKYILANQDKDMLLENVSGWKKFTSKESVSKIIVSSGISYDQLYNAMNPSEM
jgi:hypothetical protein